MGIFGLGWRIATSPVWLLWSGYKGLWWVFGDTHEPAAPAGPRTSQRVGSPVPPAAGVKADQKTSFEVMDSGPRPIAPPIRKLRGGFVGTILASLGMLLASNGMAAAGVMSPDRAMFAWVWGTALTAVMSILMVRRVARADRRRRGVASVFRDVKGAAGNAFLGAAGACRWAACNVKDKVAVGVKVGAQRAGEANRKHQIAERLKASAGAACVAARKAWSSIGRAAPETKPAA